MHHLKSYNFYLKHFSRNNNLKNYTREKNNAHHTVNAIFVPWKFCNLYGIVRIGDVPDTNVRHVTAFAGGQELAVSSKRQGSHGFATGVQHVRLAVLPRIEQNDSATASKEQYYV